MPICMMLIVIDDAPRENQVLFLRGKITKSLWFIAVDDLLLLYLAGLKQSIIKDSNTYLKSWVQIYR